MMAKRGYFIEPPLQSIQESFGGMTPGPISETHAGSKKALSQRLDHHATM